MAVSDSLAVNIENLGFHYPRQRRRYFFQTELKSEEGGTLRPVWPQRRGQNYIAKPDDRIAERG